MLMRSADRPEFAKWDIDDQTEILDLARAGNSVDAITCKIRSRFLRKYNASQHPIHLKTSVQGLVDSGVPYPSRAKPWRCPGCAHKIEFNFCIACWMESR